MVWIGVGVASGGNPLQTSPDGGAWTSVSILGSWDNGQLVEASGHAALAVLVPSTPPNRARIVVRSTDAAAWAFITNALSSSSQAFISDVVYGNGVWLLLGTDRVDNESLRTCSLLRSIDDGLTFATSDPFTSWLPRHAVWASSLGLFLLVAQSLTGSGDSFWTSADGASWTFQQTMSSAFTSTVGIAWSGSMALAVTGSLENEGSATSSDGIGWTERLYNDRPTRAILPHDVAWSGATFLVPCRDPLSSEILVTTSDGMTWVSAATPENGHGGLGECAAVHSGLRIVGLFGTPQAIITSTDDVLWNAQIAGSEVFDLAWLPLAPPGQWILG